MRQRLGLQPRIYMNLRSIMGDTQRPQQTRRSVSHRHLIVVRRLHLSDPSAQPKGSSNVKAVSTSRSLILLFVCARKSLARLRGSSISLMLCCSFLLYSSLYYCIYGTVFALYKGLTAVYTGIIPKMAIRFVSFEFYKEKLGEFTGNKKGNTTVTFTAGLASGLTEAVVIVTPAEVCKIRMQSQHHSLMDATARQHRKYKGVVHTAVTIVREEGFGALYKGVVPTMLRQGCNQAVNFTAYNAMKQWAIRRQDLTELPSYQSLVLGVSVASYSSVLGRGLFERPGKP